MYCGLSLKYASAQAPNLNEKKEQLSKEIDPSNRIFVVVVETEDVRWRFECV